jgi:hypothetical protein
VTEHGGLRVHIVYPTEARLCIFAFLHCTTSTKPLKQAFKQLALVKLNVGNVDDAIVVADNASESGNRISDSTHPTAFFSAGVSSAKEIG